MLQIGPLKSYRGVSSFLRHANSHGTNRCNPKAGKGQEGRLKRRGQRIELVYGELEECLPLCLPKKSGGI